MADRMPAIFFGHGNPLNALASNAWTDGWAAVGKEIPRPRAVLCVSAHWYLPATLVTGEHGPLIAYETLGRDATLSVPTPDHYLPLLYVIAQQRGGEQVSFPVEGFDGGSVSMLSVKIG